MSTSRLSAIILAALLFMPPALRGDPPPAASPPAARWGEQDLAHIRERFYMPGPGLYALEINNGKKPHPAWIWDASIQLGALCSAARVEPATYLPQVHAYAAALRAYRTEHEGLPGLDVNPPPKPSDRYYDDNAWICLSLLEAHALTHDPKDLQLAEDAYRFTLSGEDKKAGGLFWHEDRTSSKNACSSGPAMLDALAFYRLRGDPKDLKTAKRLYDWTRAHLQDKDGLVFDSLDVATGKVKDWKFTYNTATLLKAACILHQITHERAYLDEAERVAASAERRFVHPDGAIEGAGKLGVKLVGAFLELYHTDGNAHWLQVVERALTTLHAHRDKDGWYPAEWQQGPPDPSRPVRLIDQSAPARAFWLLAEGNAKAEAHP